MSGKALSTTLLAKYLGELNKHPLRTKAITGGLLSFLQEILGSNLANIPVNRPSRDAPVLLHILARSHINMKAIKMALYGFLISAPLGHFLIGTLQKAFTGKTGPGARIAQIFATNLLVAPIQVSIYLASLAVINGARSVDDVLKTVKAGFFSVMRIQWLVSPVSLVLAQRFLDPQLWVPFFSLIQFTLGTYFNMKVKRLRMQAAKHEDDEKKKD